MGEETINSRACTVIKKQQRCVGHSCASEFSPAMASCMMKKFMRDLRFLEATMAMSTERFPITMKAKSTPRKATCSFWKYKKKQLRSQKIHKAPGTLEGKYRLNCSCFHETCFVGMLLICKITEDFSGWCSGGILITGA